MINSSIPPLKLWVDLVTQDQRKLSQRKATSNQGLPAEAETRGPSCARPLTCCVKYIIVLFLAAPACWLRFPAVFARLLQKCGHKLFPGGVRGAGVRPDHFLLFGRMRWNHARLSFLLPLRLFHLKCSINKRLLTLCASDDALDTHLIKNLAAARALEATVTDMQLLAAPRQLSRGSLATLCSLHVASWSVAGAGF